MQGPGLVVVAIFLMAALNALIILATVAVKALRASERRRVRSLREKLEPALYAYLVTGEIEPVLRQTKGRDRDTLAGMIVELIAVLRGSEKERAVELAAELGLVDRDLRLLSSRGRWRRARAAENLGFYGGPAAAVPVGALLDEKEETLRAVAARALSRIGGPDAARSLAARLDSASELTSLRMAENLERIGPLAVEPLTELLGTEECRAQVLAARILGNLRVREARPALCEAALRRQNPDLRAQATLALGKIGDPEDIPTMLEAAADESWPVRAQAANALEMIGASSTIPTLEALAVDPEWWVRLNASRALVNMGPEGEEALARILEGPDRFARDRAAATLEERGVARRLVGEMAGSGESARAARRTVRAMVRAGATRHLGRLAETLPDAAERRALRRVFAETRPDDA
jgi:HEAT repeat protein